MIHIRCIDNYIHRRDTCEMRAVEWCSKTIGELAPEGAVACVYANETHVMGSASWERKVPNDGAILTYIRTEQPPVIAAAIGVVAGVSALAAATVPVTAAAIGAVGSFAPALLIAAPTV